MKLTPGMLVRVSPVYLGGRKSPHFGRAIVISISTTTAVIKPFGAHKKTERVPVSVLRIWKSKLREDQQD